MASTTLLPVFMMRDGYAATSLRVSRVPCVGEVIHLELGEPDGGTCWRVIYVQHMPSLPGRPEREAVAEIQCVELRESEETWNRPA